MIMGTGNVKRLLKCSPGMRLDILWGITLSSNYYREHVQFLWLVKLSVDKLNRLKPVYWEKCD